MTEKEKRQIRLVKFVEDFYMRRMYPPTVRDICGGIGVKSTGTVFADAEELAASEHIRKIDGHIMPVFTHKYITKLFDRHFKEME